MIRLLGVERSERAQSGELGAVLLDQLGHDTRYFGVQRAILDPLIGWQR